MAYPPISSNLPVKYQLFKEFIAVQIERRAGHPNPTDLETGPAGDQGYFDWFVGSWGQDTSNARKYRRGESRPTRVRSEGLLKVFGYQPGTKLHAWAEHQLRRALEAKAFGMGEHLDAPPSDGDIAVCQPASGVTGPGQTLSRQKSTDGADAHRRRAIQSLREEGAWPFVQELIKECEFDCQSQASHLTKADAGNLLKALGEDATSRREPCDRVIRALVALKSETDRFKRPLGPDREPCANAATRVFAQTLLDYVIKVPASPDDANKSLLLTPTPCQISAALLFEERAGGELRFKSTNRSSRQKPAPGAPAAARQSEPHAEVEGYLTEDHSPGILAADELTVTKAGLERQAVAYKSWIAAHISEAMKDPDGDAQLGDFDLRGKLLLSASVDRRVWRLSVNLDHEEATARLKLAVKLEQDIGLPAVAYGKVPAQAPQHFSVGGEVYGNLISLQALVDRFLLAREALS